MQEKKIAFDVDGTEAVSCVLLDLLNTFPGLGTRAVEFSTLEDSGGIGFFPTSGAAILSSVKDITGHVKQVCLYPFDIVYRAAPKTEAQRLKNKEFLDCFGRWLERQPVTFNDAEHQLTEYPALNSGNRKIQTITRTNPAHLGAAYHNGIEDWTFSASLHYENEFNE